MPNYFAEVISIVTKDTVDAKALLVEIAKHNPAAVVAAHNRLSVSLWRGESERLLRDGQRIDAIRLCREYTGWGLREAVNACDKIAREMKP